MARGELILIEENKEFEYIDISSIKPGLTRLNDIRKLKQHKKNWKYLDIAFLKLSKLQKVVLKLHRCEFRANSTNYHLNKLLEKVWINGQPLTEKQIKHFKAINSNNCD